MLDMTNIIGNKVDVNGEPAATVKSSGLCEAPVLAGSFRTSHVAMRLNKRRGPGRDARAAMIVGRLFGGNGDLFHDDRRDRFVHRSGLDRFEFRQHVQAFHNLADDRVLAVKLGCGLEADVELAAG